MKIKKLLQSFYEKMREKKISKQKFFTHIHISIVNEKCNVKHTFKLLNSIMSRCKNTIHFHEAVKVVFS